MEDNMRENFSFSKHFKLKDGLLYCEDVCVETLHEQLLETDKISSPFFLFSKAALLDNITQYQDALSSVGIPYTLGYSLKANFSPHLLSICLNKGLTAVTVSGNEILLALEVGFTPGRILFNGNGKVDWEVELAVDKQVMINIDSLFDLEHVRQVSAKKGKMMKVFLRINPDINPEVHPYLATGLASSKFGLDRKQLDRALDMLRQQSELQLIGLHCHLGSTIKNTQVFKECVDVLHDLAMKIRSQGFHELRCLNLGGGLAIDYEKHKSRTSQEKHNTQRQDIPGPQDLIATVSNRLRQSDFQILLEPGRSLVGNTAALITKVIGVKSNGESNYIVVDGSMTEVIRPSLYGAYHHIELTEPTKLEPASKHRYQVVGPVCECGDYLGQDRYLNRPHEGCGVAVFDVGAYCGVMASNYNMRVRPAEVLVDGNNWTVIRRPDSYQDLIKPYQTLNKNNTAAP